MIDKEQAEQAEKAGVKISAGADAATGDKAALIAQLKALLPSAINADNQLNVDALKDALGAERTTSNNQGYELTFAGKGIAREKADTPTAFELQAVREQSKDFDNTGNAVIRGDNLDVLKILYQSYHNKIKMIYIDPPYNTQNENFVYSDNFKVSEEELIERFGLNDDTCDFLHNVYGTRSHSGWLAFMYPRLKLAKELLRDDGVMFISIDDNEQANLKLLCDEIFGEENFVAQFIWRKKYGGGKGARFLVDMHEYIYVYAKNINILSNFSLNRTKEQREVFTQTDEYYPERGKYYIRPLKSGLALRPTLIYSIKCPDNNHIKTQWICSHDTYLKLKEEGRILFKKLRDGKYNIYKKFYENDKSGKVLPESIFYDIAYNQNAKEEIKYLFDVKEGRDVPFENAKPVKLINHLLNFLDNEEMFVLDFFAGSGTTGDAVMQLNAEDGGKRKFILVQWDEKIDENKSPAAYKFCTENDFAPVISSITLERLNRAGEKIKQDHAAKNGDASDKPPLPDIGYKVFRVTPRPRIEQEGKLFNIDNLRTSAESTLFNMLAATGKPLDVDIECLHENVLYKADNELYLLANINGEALAAYSDMKINLDGWADINLQQYLSLDVVNDKNNIHIIY